MKNNETTESTTDFSNFFTPEGSDGACLPLWLASEARPINRADGLSAEQLKWLDAAQFSSAAKKIALIPGLDGSLAGAAFGLGNGHAGEPCGPSDLLIGQLPQSLPPGDYLFERPPEHPALAAMAWGLGAYRFRRYKTSNSGTHPRLVMPVGADRASVINTVEAVWLGRDLINTPASDMGPDQIEKAARTLAGRHGANVSVIVGDDLLKQNFPMIHAVGRASATPPRLIDITWKKPGGRPDAPRITLAGKGITFDTGGLNIKAGSGMRLMKKDMGGAATALTLGHLIMGQALDVRLRILIAAAENAISGNAFRPGDILTSRSGQTVEIGNTDAEGRLVLADAIDLADEESPDTLLVFATLTGAARAALGPDLPAMFSTDDSLAARLVEVGERIGDPMWRLPFWKGYNRNLISEAADMNNISDAPFAGAIIAALFLKRFVKNARRFVHIDLYGWRTATRPLGPKGGEPQSARAVFETLKQETVS